MYPGTRTLSWPWETWCRPRLRLCLWKASSKAPSIREAVLSGHQSPNAPKMRPSCSQDDSENILTVLTGQYKNARHYPSWQGVPCCHKTSSRQSNCWSRGKVCLWNRPWSPAPASNLSHTHRFANMYFPRFFLAPFRHPPLWRHRPQNRTGCLLAGGLHSARSGRTALSLRAF